MKTFRIELHCHGQIIKTLDIESPDAEGVNAMILNEINTAKNTNLREGDTVEIAIYEVYKGDFVKTFIF